MLDSETIAGFAGSLLVKQLDNSSPIPEIHKEWWDLCCQKDQFVAIAAPRRHAKSTAITYEFALASLLFREASFLVIVSDTETQANLFLGDIKQQLIENDDLISLFGVKKFVKLAETDIIVEMDDGHRFRVMTRGAEQKVRGLKWESKRPDLIICDDLENEEIVLSKDRRDKFKRWFNAALLQCKANHGKVIIVGTILHMDSLLEGLMPVSTASSTISEDLKVWSTKKVGRWHSVKYRAHNEDFSKILWRDQWSEEKLRSERQDYINQGIPDAYSQEFLNYPIDESSAYFKRDDLLPLKPEDIEEVESERVQYYSAADFAISTSERSDFTVISTVAVTSTGDLLVVDIRRGRWDSSEIIEQMFSVQKRYKPELFVVEQGAIQKAIGPFLNREMQVRGIYLNLYPMVPTKDKLTRARSLQARLRAGGMRFDKERFWYDTLEDEMARFPKDRHDDQVDSLSWIGLVLDRIVDAPTVQEIEDEEYNDMVWESNSYQGRSQVTGY
jgi:predicted phage terminase large subunit-like protein